MPNMANISAVAGAVASRLASAAGRPLLSAGFVVGSVALRLLHDKVRSIVYHVLKVFCTRGSGGLEAGIGQEDANRSSPSESSSTRPSHALFLSPPSPLDALTQRQRNKATKACKTQPKGLRKQAVVLPRIARPRAQQRPAAAKVRRSPACFAEIQPRPDRGSTGWGLGSLSLGSLGAWGWWVVGVWVRRRRQLAAGLSKHQQRADCCGCRGGDCAAYPARPLQRHC